MTRSGFTDKLLWILMSGDNNRACQHWDYLFMNWKFPMMFIQHSVNSDWLFNTQSRVLLENHEEATLNINMPY